MKFKRRINEGDLERRVLTAISNLSHKDVSDYKFLEQLFNEVISSRSLNLYKDVSAWCHSGLCDEEDCFWAGILSSDLGPNDSNEPIIYDDAGDGDVIGILNPKFTGQVLAHRLRYGKFSVDDEEAATTWLAIHG